MVGASLCPHHTNDCKISQLFGATVIFSRLRRIPFKFDNYCTNFKALFPLVSTDFPLLVQLQLKLKKKTVEGSFSRSDVICALCC